MAKQVGRVIAFTHACVRPAPGRYATAETVYLAYLDWCRAWEHAPLREGVFRDEFSRLARHIQITSEAQDGDRMYRDIDVRLRSA